MKALASVVVLAVILIGGYWLLQQGGTLSIDQASDLGSYAYACENGSGFSMSPASDMKSIKLSGGSQGMFTGDAMLIQVAGTRYEGTHMGSMMQFMGAGEGVQLAVGSDSTICNPVPNPDSPPWNWGDPGEGGGVEQDVGLIVSESIVGRWRSVEDNKFTREFKGDGTAVDTYEGASVTSGTWKVFTKEKPLSVSFPLEENTVYVQMTMQGTQADNLNFKLSKLTPEELELTYMDRGGVLRFTAIK
ncbi:hypothetical protein HY417_04375 [Candidatus Kaiserbacteria bacterium]|nr:hypothetical protein [Candidatus Kaiserbacteria bacterium]